MMAAPRILRTHLATYYGEGSGLSNEQMFFSGGLFTSLGWDEVFLPFEQQDVEATIAEVRNRGPYDAVFTMPFRDESNWIKRLVGPSVPVIAWIPDDVWRWDFTHKLIESGGYDWFLTTDARSIDSYEDAGHRQVILTNYGSRPDLWRLPHAEEIQPSLTAGFCGFLHGSRLHELQMIADAGTTLVDVHNCREQLLDMPDYFRWIGSHAFSLVPNASSQGIPQMKARLFEPQMVGSLLVAEYIQGLERYFTDGEDALFYQTPEEAQMKMTAALVRPETIAQMTERAFSRSLREHTYQHRFRAIFERIGLPVPSFPDFDAIALPSALESSHE